MEQRRASRLGTAKEVAAYFAGRGVPISTAYARALLRDCPHAVRQRYGVPEVLWDWWALHPEWRPFARRGWARQGELGLGPRG